MQWLRRRLQLLLLTLPLRDKRESVIPPAAQLQKLLRMRVRCRTKGAGWSEHEDKQVQRTLQAQHLGGRYDN